MASTEHSQNALNTRPTTPTGNASLTYDLVCIGFGPAQIATAIANRESRKPAKILFLERKPSFSWHTSPHLIRTRMENAFVYDLATTRNPRSAFSYINYLLAHNRLVEFANSDRLNPLRIEFEEYLRWSADQFSEQVRYNSEVVGVIPERGPNAVRRWSVAVKNPDGSTYVVRAKNIAAPSPSNGDESKPRALTHINFSAGQRIILAKDYVSRRQELREPRDTPLDVVIVGSGQQSVEILDDVLSYSGFGNVTIVTENDSLAPLRVLSDDPSPPSPRLCSIWSKPSGEGKASIIDSSELIQSIYTKGYEKHIRSKGKYALRVELGRDAVEPTSHAGVVISEGNSTALSTSGLFHELDALVLGCRQKGDSLEEVQFKRGAVAEGCRAWLLSANSEGGRSLAKDIAVRAGEVVGALSATVAESDGPMLINARI